MPARGGNKWTVILAARAEKEIFGPQLLRSLSRQMFNEVARALLAVARGHPPRQIKSYDPHTRIPMHVQPPARLPLRITFQLVDRPTNHPYDLGGHFDVSWLESIHLY